MSRIIAVCNQKGGVGKTTTAVNVAAAIAETGAAVLLVDLDPRADLSAYLGISISPGEVSVYDALFDPEISMQDAIQRVEVAPLDVVPATNDLAGAEILLMERPPEQRHRVVAEGLAPIRDDYDYIILDNPPGLQLLYIAALAAAEEVLVPQQTSFLALHGLRQVAQSIERIRGELNPSLRTCGIVMTMQDRRTIHNRDVIEMVREGFGDDVMDTVIPMTIRLQEAAAANLPITIYDPAGPGAEAYRSLAKEVMQRG
jgi:chromosome partitioning protein